MAHRIVIKNLGPIKKCDLTCTPFMTFTGAQASGKSTIAKAIFYFKTIKNDIYKLITSDDKSEQEKKKYITPSLILEQKFVRMFGALNTIDSKMEMTYYYTDALWIKIRIETNTDNTRIAPLRLGVISSGALTESLNELLETKRKDNSDPGLHNFLQKKKLDIIFNDNSNAIFIPAGRSIITLFSQQLLYLYSIMDDAQKRTLDYCTQNYIERILSIKPAFANGINDLLKYRGNSVFTDEKINLALDLSHKILKGDYIFANGNEQIMLNNNKRVNINYASSGQQESVWLINLLLYYFSGNAPNSFIIEEPESNLFPESQKYITELIALAYNCGDSVIVTTHSPYVLGTLNNLIYAGQTNDPLKEKVSEVIDQNLWIQSKDFSSFFVDKGEAKACIEEETGLIENELIDEISSVINKEYDQIFDIVEDLTE